MQQIINFFIKNSTKLLFLLLLVISFALVLRTHTFHKSSFISSANGVTGYVYENVNNLKEYMRLKTENDALVLENALLKKQAFNSAVVTDSVPVELPLLTTQEDIYNVIVAKVIKNEFNTKENYLTIKGGEREGITKDLGVINSNGIVGIIQKSSTKYSTVQSILNAKSKINAKIKGSNHFGTLQWDGKSTGYVQLNDIPRLAELFQGDTIVTGGISDIFPENIPIGTIEKAYTTESSNYFTIEVKLFNDMTNLGYVYVIKNNDIKEIIELEEATRNE
ncbi:rod shape-determining protein MreC [Myroides odoratus]|uniref:Cell shape-determining protein MreC n=1 Tax=Myroides odoratus TaxID=256 RepID=A0A9Q7E8Z4_MYROD|nr:rod shape-determining protein MreC [Myroides odoratus]EHQ43168.1 rod shape-determining protein MreC [Myroides odoratus DSM 2801]EKB06553.1 rod shape-determining protein MreC [Myroides odoratus CIP 103059]QQU00512.1 rod shape-determining protein MreC [Myroides odoratus]WQD57255.1 rod shape-determining protein MreC [Myroides odoratus]STZ30442.1 rod shape-determining protein MreC [Myroides odoratus]